jgi:hypothetical protein
MAIIDFHEVVLDQDALQRERVHERALGIER